MLVGYARVSGDDQNLDLQLDALKAAGCEKICTDRMTGAANDRPGLTEVFRFLRPSDTLVVWKLDRLGRSVKGLVELVATLQGRGIQFRSLTDGIDTGSAAGRFFFHVMAALAEMERDLIRERTNAGLKAARARGRMGGRRPKMDESKVLSAKRLLDSGMPSVEVAKNLGVSRATLYRQIQKAARAELSGAIPGSS